jgi:hypothetical protein
MWNNKPCDKINKKVRCLYPTEEYHEIEIHRAVMSSLVNWRFRA